MKRSTERLLTTHTGGLPRPVELAEMNDARARGAPVDPAALERAIDASVADVVRRQIAAGLSVINDGEQSKLDWARYVTQRIAGFDGLPGARPPALEAREFPEFYSEIASDRGNTTTEAACTGPLGWRDFSLVERDLARLKALTATIAAEDVFMSAASPGTIANFHPNAHYKTRESYLAAIADVMRCEYEAVVAAGFVLQIDSPDLTARQWFPDLSLKEFRDRVIAPNIEALNHATRDLLPERMRMHVCWGSNEGPHTTDIGLAEIVDLVLRARPAGISTVGANGRHQHEWSVWRDVPLPDDKVLVAGVIDPTTHIVEHPETVAERLVRYAGAVGRERVIGGVDCGFRRIDTKVAWAKLTSLAQGAAIASATLWKRS